MRHNRRTVKAVMFLPPFVALALGLLASPLLRVEQVTIVAPTPELAAEVGRQVHIPPDASTLLYPLCRICAQARSCYRVADCSVRRQLPHGLLVQVTAREPIAALRDEVGYTLLSSDGTCLYRRESRPELPILQGLVASRPPLGSRVAAEQWRWVRDVLAGATKAGLRDGLVMDFTEPFQISVKTSSGWTGTLGNVNSLTRKVTIMGRLAQQIEAEGRRPRVIDVSIPEAPRWTAI